MFIVNLFILLVSILALAFVQATALVWTLTFAIILGALTLYGGLQDVFLYIVWGVFLVAVFFTHFKRLRCLYFTAPLFSVLKKRLPTISSTEREAIEAGNIWWEKDLFCGRPQWKKFLTLPGPELTKEEQSFLENQTEILCSLIDDWKIVFDDRDLSKETWNYLKQERFFGLVIPKEYGGHGFSAFAHSTIVMKIATRSLSAAVNTMVPNSLGPAELVFHYGTVEQKEYYLPRLARGEEIPCFALTGPEAGSDAGSIPDVGTVCHGEYQGKTILGIKLNWDKRYITLAPVATVLGLAFRLYDPEKLLSDKTDIGITLCLIPTSHPGVEVGNRHLPLHLAFMNGPTRGKNVFIPLDWIIGGINKAGQGWKMLMECLSIGRSISLPALSTASGKLAYRMTGAYARVRKQFNTSLAHFEGIEEALAEIAGMTYTLETCRQLTCSALDQKIRPSIASAIAKYHMTEMARKILSHSMDIHAGHMIQVGPRNFLAHAYMASPICITVEGANILTRNLIIFGQGAIRCHPYILHEVELLSVDQPKKSIIKKLDHLLISHIGYTLANLARSFVLGLTGGIFLWSPVNDKTAKYYRQLTRMSTALALLSDVCMLILGGNLKRRERISARLGDLLSELYLASSVLKYYQDHHKPATDFYYVKWCVESCLYRMQKTCDELLQNFPIKWLGRVLRGIIFPWGAAFKKPSDHLSRKIVSTMLEPSELRDRLTEHCYIGRSATDSTWRLEKTLGKMIAIEPTLKKFQKFARNTALPQHTSFKDKVSMAGQLSFLTKEEVEHLHEYYDLYHDVIRVDEFSFDLKEVAQF